MIILVIAAALCFTFLPSTPTKQDKKPAAVVTRTPRVAEKKSQSIPDAMVEKEQTPDPPKEPRETTTKHHAEQSWELHLGRTKSPIDVGAGVKMKLVRTDWKRRLFTINVFADGRKIEFIEFKDKPIDQPISLDASKLVIHGIGKDRIDRTMTVTY